jgi:hypothetical protein
MAIRVNDYDDLGGRRSKPLNPEIERKSFAATRGIGSHVRLSAFVARYCRGLVGAVVGDDHYAIAICELRH